MIQNGLFSVPPQLRNARTQCDAHTWSINMGSLSQGYGWLAATVNRMGERIQICFFVGSLFTQKLLSGGFPNPIHQE